jgi:ubiquinone/menaquinone biosynthesis C-methylase UbiE
MKNFFNRILPFNGNNEINRLINQAVCWERESEILFDEIKIIPGWKCVDMGCGPIGILEPLSRRVGKNGNVIGYDANKDYLKAANVFINQNHLLNVNVVKGDFYDNPLFKHSFNLAHERFIFSQFGCDQQLLDIMIDLTQPGGVLVSQESDWTTWNCYPKNPSWEKMRDALISYFELDGGDINAGKRTYKMFSSALSDVHIRTIIKALPSGHTFRAGMNQMAVSLRDKIIDANVLRADEFDEALEGCNQVVNDRGAIIFSYMLCQVWGHVKK